jgi:hypothetical protein
VCIINCWAPARLKGVQPIGRGKLLMLAHLHIFRGEKIRMRSEHATNHIHEDLAIINF